MESSGVKIGLEKFDGKGSFTMWKVRVEDLLVQMGLDLALEDRPGGMNDKEWMSLEKRACAAIRACLADEVLYGVLEERTPKGLWSRLHTMYMGKNMCNKLVLKKQLYSLRMQEGENVAGHIQRFDRMSMDLLNIGVEFEEEDKSLLLLCSLPGSFDPLVTTLLYGKETLVYEEIVSVLRSNEQRERMTKREVFQQGLAVSEKPRRWKNKGEQAGRAQSRTGSTAGRCYRCGVVGHFKRECPLRKKCKEGERKEVNFSGSVTGSDEELGELLYVSEDPAACSVSEMASTGSAECGGVEGAVTGDEVQRRSQQGSAEWLASGFHSVASGGLQSQVEHRTQVASQLERVLTRGQSGGVHVEDSHPSTSARGALRQVEQCAQTDRHGSEEVVSGRAPGAARTGSLQSLQGSPRKKVDAAARQNEGYNGPKVVPGCKQGSSAGEAVIPKASKGAQQLKGVGKGKGKEIRTRSCQDTRLQRRGAGGYCRVCQGLGAPRWRL